MDTRLVEIATACLRSAEDNTLTFPQIIGTLMGEGFESYTVDFRRRAAIYYRADGDSVELKTTVEHGPVAEAFDAATVQAAIREAQALVPGYTYRGFCAKVTAAGCTGYVVSFPGRRAVYSGRTAETHVERFPD